MYAFAAPVCLNENVMETFASAPLADVRYTCAMAISNLRAHRVAPLRSVTVSRPPSCNVRGGGGGRSNNICI